MENSGRRPATQYAISRSGAAWCRTDTPRSYCWRPCAAHGDVLGSATRSVTCFNPGPSAMTLRWLAALLGATLLLLAAGGVELSAQQPPRPPANVQQAPAPPVFHNPLSDLLRLFSPQPQPQVVPQNVPRTVVRKRPPVQAPVVVTDTPSPKVDPTVFIAVLGDTLGELLAGGLIEAFEANPDVLVLRRTRNNSGLVRDDFYDWRKGARDIATGADKVTHAVMMVGSNDRQALRSANGVML